jgi:hypothetical protein
MIISINPDPSIGELLMKSFKNIMLIILHLIDFQYFSFFSIHSYGYESQKELRPENQADTTYFNLRF